MRSSCCQINGTMIHVTDAFYAPKPNQILLSFRDIHANRFHLETLNENGQPFLFITFNDYGRKRILEKLMSQTSGLYLTTIRIIESCVVSRNFCDSDSYKFWHDRLGHPGRNIMIQILKNSHRHPFFLALKRFGAPPSTE